MCICEVCGINHITENSYYGNTCTECNIRMCLCGKYILANNETQCDECLYGICVKCHDTVISKYFGLSTGLCETCSFCTCECGEEAYDIGESKCYSCLLGKCSNEGCDEYCFQPGASQCISHAFNKCEQCNRFCEKPGAIVCSGCKLSKCGYCRIYSIFRGNRCYRCTYL